MSKRIYAPNGYMKGMHRNWQSSYDKPPAHPLPTRKRVIVYGPDSFKRRKEWVDA
jgi:hypothetical protein